ncbi:MAG: WD40/YVTN/BNR-like repeat-containing protein [Mycobacterium sp.]
MSIDLPALVRGRPRLIALAVVSFVLVVAVSAVVTQQILQMFETTSDVSPQEGEEGDDPEGFVQWLTDSRGVGENGLPVDLYVQAEQTIRAQIARQRQLERAGDDRARVISGLGAAASPWTWLGPHNWGGRSRAFVVNPVDRNVMLAGGTTGGIWRSEDAGASWAPLTDTFSNISVGVLELDPNNPQVVYAGTGEAYFKARGEHRGNGIMKSTDGGISWSFLASTTGRREFHYVGDIEVSHHDSNRVYAATGTGVWLSTDGGASWGDEPVLASGAQETSVGCLELALRNDMTPDVVFASCGHQDDPDGVYRSESGGIKESWERVLPAGADPIGVTALAIAPGDQNVMYASISNTQKSAYGLFRSTEGGVAGSWQLRADPQTGPDWLKNCRFPKSPGQGGYDNVVAVDPTNADRVWVGGIDLFRSDDGGATLRIASDWQLSPVDGTPYAHADQHVIAFDPAYDGNTNRTVYFANDGGLFRTDDDRGDLAASVCKNVSGITFTSMNNGFGIAQFVGGAVSDDGNIVVGGTQDNGTFRLDKGAGTDWVSIFGGDGGNGAIHPKGAWVIVSTYYASFVRLTGDAATGGECRDDNCVYARGGNMCAGLDSRGEQSCDSYEFFGFYPPLERDPRDANVLWAGGKKVWRTLDVGDKWVAVSDVLSEDYPYITALAVGATNGNLVYAGTTDGQLFRSTNALSEQPTWDDVDPGNTLPTAQISSIAIDPANEGTVLVGFQSFDGRQLWRSASGGPWEAVDTSIPDTPVNAIAINPHNTAMIYVGTDVGIFESLDGGDTWRVANENLATTLVNRLVFRPDSTELYAFTHGRGVYLVDVGDVSPPLNDEVSHAKDVELSPDYRDRVDIRAGSIASTDPALTCGSALLPTQTRSVWYRFVPTETGNYSVTTVGSNFDTVLAVFGAGSGVDGDLAEVACNDDAITAQGSSALTFEGLAGTTYYVEATRSARSPTDTLANTLEIVVSKP